MPRSKRCDSAEAEQLKRIEEAEARLREQEQARQAARAKATQLADQEEQLEEELKSFQAEERSQFDRLQQLQARVREEEEAIQVATAEARREADQAEQRLAELESTRMQLAIPEPVTKSSSLWLRLSHCGLLKLNNSHRLKKRNLACGLRKKPGSRPKQG